MSTREGAVAGRGGLHAVLGTGPLGMAVIRHLAGTGQRVRAVARGVRDDLPEGVELVAADVAHVSEAERACDGADVVDHCANPLTRSGPSCIHHSCRRSSGARPQRARSSCSGTTSTPTAPWTDH